MSQPQFTVFQGSLSDIVRGFCQNVMPAPSSSFGDITRVRECVDSSTQTDTAELIDSSIQTSVPQLSDNGTQTIAESEGVPVVNAERPDVEVIDSDSPENSGSEALPILNTFSRASTSSFIPNAALGSTAAAGRSAAAQIAQRSTPFLFAPGRCSGVTAAAGGNTTAGRAAASCSSDAIPSTSALPPFHAGAGRSLELDNINPFDPENEKYLNDLLDAGTSSGSRTLSRRRASMPARFAEEDVDDPKPIIPAPKRKATAAASAKRAKTKAKPTTGVSCGLCCRKTADTMTKPCFHYYCHDCIETWKSSWSHCPRRNIDAIGTQLSEP